MKITNINNPQRFFEVVQQCEGRVELITTHGDRLNLKSVLCQFISLTNVFNNPEIGEIEIMCGMPEDVAKILEFLVRG